MKRRKQKITKQEEEFIDEAFNAIVTMLNNYGHDSCIFGFIDKIAFEHRSLQQLFTRLMVEWIKELDEKYKAGQGCIEGYDARNHASCLLGNKIIESCEDHLNLPFI